MPTRNRFPQPQGTKGSLKWTQRLAEASAPAFAAQLQQALSKPPNWTPTWVSPLESDGRAEYRDDGFLRALGLRHLADELRDFWPRGGPQWDGLATVPGGVLLVEAKAHLAELGSSCGAGPRSAARIRAAIDETKRSVGAPLDADWMNGFYQYANRLAHLRFLRERGVDAYLVFLYFCGDQEMPTCPTSAADWRAGLQTTYSHLGLDSSPPYVASVFMDVASLTEAPATPTQRS